MKGGSRASSEQGSAFETLNPLIKAESPPIHHPENTLQVWVSCSKYGRQISKTHSETKAFHSSFCFSKSLNTVTLVVSHCSMNNVSELNATAEVSKVRWGLSESQMKAKRGSNDGQASQKMLHFANIIISRYRFDTEEGRENSPIGLWHFIKIPGTLNVLLQYCKQRNAKKRQGAVKACPTFVPTGGFF